MPGVSGAGGGPGFDPTTSPTSRTSSRGLGDIFGFGDMFGGRRRRGGPQRGADLRYDLEISFEESATGTETTIQIPREETCETCKGSGAAPGTHAETCAPVPAARASCATSRASSPSRGPAPNCRGTGKMIAKPCQTCRGAGRVGRERKLTVKIPAGIATGQRLRLYGEGEHGSAGGPPGDLYVVVHVQEHSFFHREEDDLYCELPVSFPTLALGGDDQGADARRATRSCTIPAGTQPGARFKLRGKGMPNVSGRGQGDLHVIARVAVPKKLIEGTEAPARGARARRCRDEKLDDDGDRAARSRSSSGSRTSLAEYPALDLRFAAAHRCRRPRGSALRRARRLPAGRHPRARGRRRLARVLPLGGAARRGRRRTAAPELRPRSWSAGRRAGRRLGAPQPGQPDAAPSAASSWRRRGIR